MNTATASLAPKKEEIKAIHLSVDDLKIAASILFNAYVDDPLFVDIFQAEKEGYESRLRSAIREELNAFWVAFSNWPTLNTVIRPRTLPRTFSHPSCLYAGATA